MTELNQKIIRALGESHVCLEIHNEISTLIATALAVAPENSIVKRLLQVTLNLAIERDSIFEHAEANANELIEILRGNNHG